MVPASASTVPLLSKYTLKVVVFVLAQGRAHDVPEQYLGPQAEGILVVDRYKALTHCLARQRISVNRTAELIDCGDKNRICGGGESVGGFAAL